MAKNMSETYISDAFSKWWNDRSESSSAMPESLKRALKELCREAYSSGARMVKGYMEKS